MVFVNCGGLFVFVCVGSVFGHLLFILFFFGIFVEKG